MECGAHTGLPTATRMTARPSYIHQRSHLFAALRQLHYDWLSAEQTQGVSRELAGQLAGLLHGRSCEHIHIILRYKLLINSRLLISFYVILAYTGLEFLGTILR